MLIHKSRTLKKRYRRRGTDLISEIHENQLYDLIRTVPKSSRTCNNFILKFQALKE